MTPIYLSFMFVQEMKMHEELVSTANELQKGKKAKERAQNETRKKQRENEEMKKKLKQKV
ncbi:hypothetical protein GBAR_LOCUS16323 [Geodia barretti]|uniref:Uncharacterized protein n=1 Tax=Geodia barretti TaxID=519541 RepID=A0AA35SHE6_GEOBA|nr:hypothetical protein GBAR_LOCUS16323 [Geodia barretti]